MKLLVGLGNPGKQYKYTRHNIGYRFLDQLADEYGLNFGLHSRFQAEIADWRIQGERVLLMKPQTFMNNSGEAVAAVAHYYHLDVADIFVIHDDLALPPGKVRLRAGGSHGGHNGIKSIHQHLHDPGYTRIKIGIGYPPHSGDVTPWVLGRACAEDVQIETAALACLLVEIDTIFKGLLAEASNRIHLCMQKKQPDQET